MHKTTSHKSYRPLTVLTFRWNYAFSELSPAMYHLTNAVIHAAACWLLFVLCTRIFDSRKSSFLCALIFAVHSIHTEAVCEIHEAYCWFS